MTGDGRMGAMLKLPDVSLSKEDAIGRDEGPNDDGDVETEVGLTPLLEVLRCAQYFSSILVTRTAW